MTTSPINDSRSAEVNLESDLSSPNSLNDMPDFMNVSIESLHKLAGLSYQDQFIFDD